ncbi:MAG: TonB-dependent receptor plug domain-containing protein [Gemmatimonadota bacterium]
MRRVLCACAATLLSAAPLLAQSPADAETAAQDTVLTANNPLSLEALVVTAARRLQRLKDVVPTILLITRRDIEESGAPDAAAVIAERTGITLEGGHPAGAGVMLQGFGAERVLVLLDGQPLVGRIAGVTDLSRISSSLIERVEIVKGPQSTLFGSDAIGGVVNIITRQRAVESLGGLSLVTGSSGRLDAHANLAGALGGAQTSLELGGRSIDHAPGRSDASGALARRADALWKLTLHPAAATSFSTSIFVIDERQRWQSGQIYRFADNTQLAARAAAEITRGAHRFKPTLHATQFSHLSRRATAPEPLAGTGETERQRLIEAELLYNGGARGVLFDGGIELKREYLHSDRVIGTDRMLDAIESFAQVTIPAGPVTIVPGSRISSSEQWGTSFTPHVSMRYSLSDATIVRAAVGRGFRAPAFKELYMEFLNIAPGLGYVVRGNPELRPESSRNATLGFEWARDRWYVRAQSFYNQFDDFIETGARADSAGLNVYTYENVESGVTRGFESELGATIGRVRAEVGYSYLDAYAGDTRAPLLGRPSHSGRIALSFAAPSRVHANLSVNDTGATPVQRTESGVVEREGFARVDARLARPLPGGLQLSVGVENAFESTPAGWPDFSGRQLYIGLSWQE